MLTKNCIDKWIFRCHSNRFGNRFFYTICGDFVNKNKIYLFLRFYLMWTVNRPVLKNRIIDSNRLLPESKRRFSKNIVLTNKFFDSIFESILRFKLILTYSNRFFDQLIDSNRRKLKYRKKSSQVTNPIIYIYICL